MGIHCHVCIPPRLDFRSGLIVMEVCDWKNTKCSKEILSFVWYCRSFSFIVSTHASSLYAGTPSIADFEVYKPWLHFSNIAMENGPFVDYLPIKHRDFHSYVRLLEGTHCFW